MPGGERDGRRRRPSGTGHRRRGGHPVAGHQHGDRRADVAVPAPGRRPLPGPAAADGVRRRGRRRDGLRPLRHALRRPAPERGRVVRPLRRAGAAPGARRDRRDHAGGGQLALPPARAGAPRAARARFGAGRRPRHGGRAPPGRGGTRRHVRARCGARRPGGRRRRGSRGRTPRRGRRGGGASERGLRRGRRRRWRLDRGGRRVARHETARRPHEGPDRASRRRGGDGRVADRAAAAHPLSRALARGAGGLRRHVRGRGRVLRQRDRRGSPRAAARVPDGGAGTERRHLPRDAGRAAAHVGRRSRRRGPAAGLGQRLGGDGHGANGLLQGPYSARVLAHDMAGVAQPADEAPLPGSFDPGRFA